MRTASLLEKIKNKEYVESLCPKSKRELEICKLMLSEEELASYNSISVAYSIARDRLIEQYFPHLRDRYKRRKVPLFVNPNDLKR